MPFLTVKSVYCVICFPFWIPKFRMFWRWCGLPSCWIGGRRSRNRGNSFHHWMSASFGYVRFAVRLLSLISFLASTSTLAMGLNLPAHLVVIKNTEQLVNGSLRGYSATQLAQMIGRAGRPPVWLSVSFLFNVIPLFKLSFWRCFSVCALHIPNQVKVSIIQISVTGLARLSN